MKIRRVPSARQDLSTIRIVVAVVVVVLGAWLAVRAQSAPPVSGPAFVDGLAQPVFAGQPVVRHNVWVEVPGLDTDRDGVDDRIRLQVSRPDATERGTRLPVVLVASPYAGGTRPYPQYDVNVPLFAPGTTPRAVIAPMVRPRRGSP